MLQYTRSGNVFTVTAATTAEADRFAHLLDEQPNDLGDLTDYNARRAVLMADWEAARDAYDKQEQITLNAQEPQKEMAKLAELKAAVKAAHKKLKDQEEK